MVRPALIDSNILVDHFNGIQEADTEISYYDDVAISAITWMELMTGFEDRLNGKPIPFTCSTPTY